MRGFVFGLLIALLAAPAMAQPTPAPGAIFRDCANCPEMIVIPSGAFTMGGLGAHRSQPAHKVTIPRAFGIGRYELTFEEWDACVTDGGCTGWHPEDQGWGHGKQPVINVSWDHAQSYVTWIGRKSGKKYRLPSEAEWEYVARAGSQSYYPWGDQLGTNNANCDGCGSAWDHRRTAPVGSFKANRFGVYDMIGNVSEWVEDRWNATYDGAPTDDSAWLTGDPRRVVVRGGSWYYPMVKQNSIYRNGDSPEAKNSKIGFRVAVSLP